jgi:hypothetical protein
MWKVILHIVGDSALIVYAGFAVWIFAQIGLNGYVNLRFIEANPYILGTEICLSILSLVYAGYLSVSYVKSKLKKVT